MARARGVSVVVDEVVVIVVVVVVVVFVVTGRNLSLAFCVLFSCLVLQRSEQPDEPSLAELDWRPLRAKPA